MTFDKHKNFAIGQVLTPPSPATSGTSLTLETGQGALMPEAPFNAVCWPPNEKPLSTNAEVVRVTHIATDMLTIERKQEGSTAQSIARNYQFSDAITAKDITAIEELVNAAQLVVNVKEFGATGNGSTDDTKAIEEAIASIQLLAGTVYFPRGTYLIKKTLSIAGGTRLVGAGWGSKIIAGSGIGSEKPMIQMERGPSPFLPGRDGGGSPPKPGEGGDVGIGIEHLTIDGGGVSNGRWGILFCPNTPEYPVTVRGCVINDCNIQNCHIGIRHVNDQGLKVHSTYLQFNDIGAYATDNSQLASYDFCQFRNNNTVGTLLESSSTYGAGQTDVIYGFLFTRCSWENNVGKAIILDGAEETTFNACKWEANEGDYLTQQQINGIDHPSEPCGGMILINPIFEGTEAGHFQLKTTAGSGLLIIGGRFRASSGEGVSFWAGDSVLTIGALIESTITDPGHVHHALGGAPTAQEFREKEGTLLYKTLTLEHSPLSYWRMDKTTSAEDLGSVKLNGTLHGSIPLQGGALRPGADFDPANKFTKNNANYFSLEANAGLNLTKALTVEAWIYPTVAAENGVGATIFEKTVGGNTHTAYALCNDEGKIRGELVKEGTPNYAIAVKQMSLNVWHHVAMTYDGTTLRVYEDAVEVAKATVAEPIHGGSGESIIGAAQPGAPERYNPFGGGIDEVAVFGTALSATVIREKHEAGLGLLEPATEVLPAVYIPYPAGYSPEEITEPAAFAAGTHGFNTEAEAKAMREDLAKVIAAGKVLALWK